MKTNDTPHDIGEQNIERLLSAAYKPESADPAFAQTVEEYLCGKAREMAEKRAAPAPAPEDTRYRRLRRRLGWAMAVAACVAVWAMVYYARNHRGPRLEPPVTGPDIGTQAIRWQGDAPVGLTPQARPAGVPAKAMLVGEQLRTGAGERRRVTLADGSILYLNQHTAVTQVGSRQLDLAGGDVYVEVAPGQENTFVVTTPSRAVSALGTHFAVQAKPAGTGVIVTQGKVRVSGLDNDITAGQQVEAGSTNVKPAPRASHVLDWTRELMAAAESPLVPSSKHAGGALIALDPNGQEVQLSLRKYHIDVHIEDGFARTTIDQTYFNTNSWRMEGTFYFPLPADATLSRLAMYVKDGQDCKLMEGGMAERDHARNVYETILHTRRDPALLEWVDGSTFKMRVFPLEGREEKRIILSYTQRLPSLYGASRFRFPGGHNMELVRDWSFRALIRGGARLQIATEPNLQVSRAAGDAVVTAQAKNIKPDMDVTLELTDKAKGGQAGKPDLRQSARFSGFSHEGAEYLMVRYRPELKSPTQRQRRDWVFLFESSANRNPLLARAQIDVIRYLLLNAEHDDTFAIVTAGTRARLFDKKARPATPENIAEAVKFLESTHLIGGLDLENAINAATPLLQAVKNPHFVHVGAGIPALGERRDEVLAKRIGEGVRYVGIGVGKRWNRALMKMAAERTAGYFRQINPDEPIAWHAFDLMATLNTPRLMDLRVVDNAEKAMFLSETSMVSQGEEICAIARIDREAMPDKITISGKLNGKAFVRVLDVKNIAPNAGYLPRAWAKLEIDCLLADGGDKNKERIIELSKASYVMSPYTSLLVLETDADYARFNVDRGRKDHWALYLCPERIPVVFEPVSNIFNPPSPANTQAKRPKQEVLQTILVRVPPRVLKLATQQYYGAQVFTAWQLYAGAYAMVSSNEGLEEEREVRLGKPWNYRSYIRPHSNLGRLLRRTERLGDFAESFDGDPMLTDARSLTEALQRRIETSDLYNITERPGRIQFAPVFDSPTMQWSVPDNGRATGEMPRLPFDSLGLPELGIFVVRGSNPELIQQAMNVIQGRTNPELIQQAMNVIQGRTVLSNELEGFRFGSMNRQAVPGGFGWMGSTQTWTNGLGPVWDVAWSPDGRGLTAGEIGQVKLWNLSGDILNGSMPAFVSGLTPAGTFTPDLNIPISYRGYLRRQALSGQNSLVYSRPAFTGDNRIFNDLTIYAPGLSTTTADIQAVLEAEAKLDRQPAPGRIDPAARSLIAKARAGGWQALTIPGAGKQAGLEIISNGAGHYTYERVLSSGLRETVVCNGKTLVHLYPEIGLGSHRSLSRFHQAELTSLVPWFLPAAEDLARGADVTAINDTTVAMVPHLGDKPGRTKNTSSLQVHLVFAADGRLRERQIVEMPRKKILFREVYDANGTVAWFKGTETKPVHEIKLALRSVKAPNLTPATAKLVMVPMPMRTVNAVHSKIAWDGHYSKLDEDKAVALMAAHCWQQDSPTALHIFGQRFHSKGDRRLGFYTLLASCNTYFNNNLEVKFVVAADHPREPLAKYLAHVNKSYEGKNQEELGEFGPVKDGLLQRLGVFRDVWTRFSSGKVNQASPAERKTRQKKALAYIKDCPSPLFAWALLETIERQAGGDLELYGALAEAYLRLSKETGLGYAARYEHARCLLNAGQHEKAAQAFEKLYTDSFKQGDLPLLDAAFRNTLQNQGGRNVYQKLMRQTLAGLIEKRQPAAGLALAWQNWQLGDQPMADELLTKVLASASGKEKPFITLAVIQFLMHINQSARADIVEQGIARADTLLQELMKEDKIAEQAGVWRLAAGLAQRRGKLGRAVACLEKALDMEYKNLPELVNLQKVRADYTELLNQYHQLALAINLLETEVPRKFLAKVVQAADRWRSLDSDSTQPCQLAAKILQALGARDLAWDYLTTPIGMRPNEAAPWLSLVGAIRDTDFEMADRAYAMAFQAEPTNAQILWDHAQYLQQYGRLAQARDLYRQLADGDWQPRFQALKVQAKGQLNN